MSTISQSTLSVPLEGRDPVTVRRMRWKPAVGFLKKLSSHFSSLLAPAPLPLAPGPGAPQVEHTAPAGGVLGALEGILGRLPELIASSEDLVDHLLEHSAGLTAVQTAELDALEVLRLLEAALALNLGDDVKNAVAGLGARLAAVLPAKSSPAAGAS